MLARIASRPRLAVALVTLAVGTPYAAVVTAWVALLFTVHGPLGLLGLMECCVAASAVFASALAGLWLRAPPPARKSRASLAAILATALGWSATLVALGLRERTMRAFGLGIPIFSIDYLRFVTEDFRILWTLWLACTFALLGLIVGSWLTLFTPWFVSVYIGSATLRLVDGQASPGPTAAPGGSGKDGR